MNLVDARGNPGHSSLVVYLHSGHLPTTSTHSHEGITEGKNTGGHGSGILAQRVSSDHVRQDAVSRKQSHDGDVDRQGRRLRDLGVAQSLELLLFWNVWVSLDEVPERPTELRGHHFIRLVEGRRNDWVHLG